jgi:hypothetical protein
VSFNCALAENTWLDVSRDSDEKGERIRLAERKCDQRKKFARENTQCRNASPAIQLRPIKTGKERMRANVIGASWSERGAAESLRLKHMMAQISHKPAP